MVRKSRDYCQWYCEPTDLNKTQNKINKFHESFFKKYIFPFQIKAFLDKVHSPKLSVNEINECENELAELFTFLLSMQNNKSPGNNEVIKEFFITCWTEEKMLN